MSREIKFRAWDKTGKKWIDDNLYIYLSGSLMRVIFDKAFDGGLGMLKTIEPYDNSLKDNIVLLQYTGLKDKNGKEIYEGDIIDVGGNINLYKERGEVIFEHGCFFFNGSRFTPKHLTIYPRDLLCECQTTFYNKNTPPEIPLTKFTEIIGNIYENPELLKEA